MVRVGRRHLETTTSVRKRLWRTSALLSASKDRSWKYWSPSRWPPRSSRSPGWSWRTPGRSWTRRLTVPLSKSLSRWSSFQLRREKSIVAATKSRDQCPEIIQRFFKTYVEEKLLRKKTLVLIVEQGDKLNIDVPNNTFEAPTAVSWKYRLKLINKEKPLGKA